MAEYYLCGAAKRNISPNPEDYSRLFCVMPFTKFAKKEGELYVRAIAIGNGTDTALFILYELDQAPFPNRTMDEISGAYGIPRENIFVLGNHSHEIPVTGIRAAEESHNRERLMPEHYEATVRYENLCLAACREAVDEAIAAMQPAKLSWGSGDSFVNMHRDMKMPSVYPLDRTLFVLKAETLSGAPIAILLNYSTHNNAVKTNELVTADFEGCVSAIMEDRFPGAVCMWTLSAHGDIMCRNDYWNVSFGIKAPEFADPLKSDDSYVKRMRVLSMRHAEDALHILENMRPLSAEDCEIAGSVAYADAPTYEPVKNEDGSITHMGGLVTLSAERIAAMPERARKRMAEGAEKSWHLRLHTVRLGGLVFIGNGGKLYNAYKSQIRNTVPYRFQSVVLSQDCCEDSTVTYILDDRALLENAEKGQLVAVKPGSIASAIDAATRKMLTEIGIEPVPKF